MNLDGKCILIDKDNAKSVITFLYDIGYKWNIVSEPDVEYTIIQVIEHFLDNFHKDFLYIQIKDKLFNFDTYCGSFTFIDIKQIIREYKLKRILK